MSIYDDLGIARDTTPTGTAPALQDNTQGIRSDLGINTVSLEDTSIGGGLYAVDADTFGVEGSGARYRLDGVDAREIAKVLPGQVSLGQHGGREQMAWVTHLARKYGYNRVVPLGRKGAYGREIADLQNENGESFTDRLIREGILNPSRYATSEQVSTSKFGALEDALRDQKIREGDTSSVTEWDIASADLKNTIAQEGLHRKLSAINEAEYAAGQEIADQLGIDNPYDPATIQFRHGDRDIFNRTYSPFALGWDQGWNGFQQGWYGITQALGVKLDNDWLTSIGSQNLIDLQRESQGFADQRVASVKDVDSIASAWDWAKGISGQAAPYLIGTFLSTAAGAATGAVTAGPLGAVGGAVVGFGVSLTVPAAVYAGQSWNDFGGELEGRSISLALGSGVAQASLDRLGIKGLGGWRSVLGREGLEELGDQATVGQAVKFIAKKEGISEEKALEKLRKDAIKKYADDFDLTTREADEVLGALEKEAIAELTGDAIKVASSQVTLGRIARNRINGLLQGGSLEAGTEAAQETIAYGAAILGSDGRKTWNWDEYGDRIANALAAGGILGGGIGTITSSSSASNKDWRQLSHDLKEAGTNPNRSTQAGDNVRTSLGVTDIESGITYAESLARRSDPDFTDSFDAKVKRGSESLAGRTYAERAATVAALDNSNSVLQLLQSEGLSTISTSQANKSPEAAIIGSVFGGRVHNILPGNSAELNSQLKGTELKNLILNKETFFKRIGKKPLRTADQKEVFTAYNEVIQKIILPELDGKQPDYNSLSEFARTNVDAFRNLYHSAENGYNAELELALENAKQRGYKLGREENYAAKHRGLVKDNVAKHQQRVIGDLQRHNGLTHKEASDLTDRIIYDGIFDEEFTHLKAGKPGSAKERTIRFSETKDKDGNLVYDYILDYDPWNNFERKVDASVNTNTVLKYFGQNGEKLNALLNEAVRKGDLSKEEADLIAFKGNRIINIINGNYKPIKNKTFKAITRNVSSTLNILYGPAFIFSSIPELANAAAMSTKYGIGFTDNLKGTSIDTGKAIFSLIKQSLDKDSQDWPELEGHPTHQSLFNAPLEEKFRASGFGSQQITQATVTGVKEQETGWRFKVGSVIFKYGGLTGWTEATRMARMATFDDFIWGNVLKLSTWKEGDPWLNKHQEARNNILSVGMDPDKLSELVRTGQLKLNQLDNITDPGLLQYLNESYKTGLVQWTDLAIPNPGAANRPAIYNNPHLRMLLMYQGFISTYTAQHLPRLWDRFKNKGPQVRYNVFSQMVALAALAYLSQATKDYLNYGFDDREHPLSEGKKVYRALRKTGLLGTPERVLDLFFPLYEDRGILDKVIGQGGPTVQAGETLFKAGERFVEGQVAQGLNQLLRVTPGTSLSTSGRHKLVQALTGEDISYR